MAFLSKVGNILKQSVTKRIRTEVSPFKVSAFQAIRCMCDMSSSKVFIGGISYQMDEQSLREAFAKYGDVVDARIIMDRDSGRSRGFGFVTFTSTEGASSAIQALDGQELLGRRVRVNYASDRRTSGGYSGGGGYNSGYGRGGGGGYYGGGGGGGDGGNYGGGGGDGGNYGGGGGNYSSSYGSYGTAATPGGDYGNYGGNAGGFPAGGARGSDNFAGSFGGNKGFSGGYDGSAGQGLGGSDELSGNSGNAGMDNGFGNDNRDEPMEGSFRDDDDTDFAKRA